MTSRPQKRAPPQRSAPAATRPRDEAYVWIWLPDATEPVVAGRVVRNGARFAFIYGRSYLDRPEAVPVYLPELPLERGVIAPPAGLTMAGALRDGLPDAWGRRAILNRMMGRKGLGADVDALDDLTCMLESDSDRAGALDFQASPLEYVSRTGRAAGLAELQSAAEKIEEGVPLPPDLDRALVHGTSLGGARPKAAIQDGDRKFIAKFSSSADIRNVVKAEFAAMRLAAKVGLDVAPVRLERVAGRDALLVERFDRARSGKGWRRRAMASALTLFGLDEMSARHAGYADLAEIVRHRFTRPERTLRELFGRLVFNILCGNTDDHARNHAAFWDGARLTLTPAYDVCPQNRTGNEAGQAMWITDDDRSSRLAACLTAAPEFLLDAKAAESLIANMIHRFQSAWPGIAEEAELTETDRAGLANRVFFNPFIFDGAPKGLSGELSQ